MMVVRISRTTYARVQHCNTVQYCAGVFRTNGSKLQHISIVGTVFSLDKGEVKNNTLLAPVEDMSCGDEEESVCPRRSYCFPCWHRRIDDAMELVVEVLLWW